MPHFCHIMTNNILPETLFSITPRHTFLFLPYSIYNKNITHKRAHNHSKIFPEKAQGQISRKGVMGKKNASPVERIPLCCSRFHANSCPFPCHLRIFTAFPCSRRKGSRRDW